MTRDAVRILRNRASVRSAVGTTLCTGEGHWHQSDDWAPALRCPVPHHRARGSSLRPGRHVATRAGTVTRVRHTGRPLCRCALTDSASHR
ncbi:hypothetical protein DC74_965 [Streptomyces noursei]|nr:hypothetical protein DC74_965 [Streptomyces noursei]